MQIIKTMKVICGHPAYVISYFVVPLRICTEGQACIAESQNLYTQLNRWKTEKTPA